MNTIKPNTFQILAFSLLSLLAFSTAASLPLAGTAEAYWMGWIKIYQAKLFTHANRQNLLAESTPVSLELCYQRSINKSQIIDAANKALPKKLSPVLSSAVKQLHEHFQDVSAGDCYQLSYTPKLGTTLYFNGIKQTQIQAKGFKPIYFGIWLGDHALSQTVKQQLLAKL